MLISGGDVRRICAIEGKPVNWRTYKSWLDQGLLTIVQRLSTGAPLFEEGEAREFAKVLPKKHPPVPQAILPVKPWTPWGKRKKK